MRILNRVIVAGVLVVPMALGAAGAAAADVVAGSSMPTQMVAAEQGSDGCDFDTDDEEEDGDFLEDLFDDGDDDNVCNNDFEDDDNGLLG